MVSRFENYAHFTIRALVLTILVIASPNLSAQTTTATPTHSGNWENTSFSLGLDTHSGNTDSIALTGKWDWNAQAGLMESDVNADASFHKNAGQDFVDSQKADWALRRAFAIHSRWFALLHNWIEHHESKGVRLRVEVGPGIGYHIFDTTNSRLTTEAGVGFTKEKHEVTDAEDDFAVFFWDTTWKRTISERTSLDHKTNLSWNLDNSEDYRGYSETDLTVQFTKSVGLKTGVTIDYDQHPVPGHEKTDWATHTMLTIKFSGKD